MGQIAAGADQEKIETANGAIVPDASVVPESEVGLRGAGVESTDAGAEQGPQKALPRAPTTPVPSRAELVAMVERLASRHKLDLDLVHALIRAESAYEVHAVSHAGAVGLMQVMPATASDYGVASVDALFDPGTNLDTGMRHLKRLLDKYGSIGHAVMAYNAGEGALERSGGFVTYPETQRYTHAVLVSYLRKKGVQPYSAHARQVVGMAVTPAMASASAGEARRGAGDESAPEAQARGPATRLTSRLSPALSRRAEAGRDGQSSSTYASQSVLDRNRIRFAGEAR
jgi:hypothetical protein